MEDVCGPVVVQSVVLVPGSGRGAVVVFSFVGLTVEAVVDSATVSVVVRAVVSAVVGSVEGTVVSRDGAEEELAAEESDAGGGLVEQAAMDTQKRAQKTRIPHFFIGYTSLTCLQYTRTMAKSQPPMQPHRQSVQNIHTICRMESLLRRFIIPNKRV